MKENSGGFDRVLFGAGSSRGRKRHSSLEVNDVIDFWRVEDLEENHLLLLRTEMRLPGKTWLDFHIDEEENGRRLTVTKELC